MESVVIFEEFMTNVSSEKWSEHNTGLWCCSKLAIKNKATVISAKSLCNDTSRKNIEVVLPQLSYSYAKSAATTYK